jgi:hypothetical protein
MALSFASVAIVWTSFRLWVRRKGYWWDDICAALALLFLVGEAAIVTIHIKDPLGTRLYHKECSLWT